MFDLDNVGKKIVEHFYFANFVFSPGLNNLELMEVFGLYAFYVIQYYTA